MRFLLGRSPDPRIFSMGTAIVFATQVLQQVRTVARKLFAVASWRLSDFVRTIARNDRALAGEDAVQISWPSTATIGTHGRMP